MAMSDAMRLSTLLIDQNASCNESGSDKNRTPISLPYKWEFLGAREIQPRDPFDGFYIHGIHSSGGDIQGSWSSPVEIFFKRNHPEDADKRAHQQNRYDYSTHGALHSGGHCV